MFAREYPARQQRTNGSGASSSGEAFFEDKSYQPCNTRLDQHNNKETKHVNCIIVIEPRRRSSVSTAKKNKKLDRKYAADMLT